MQMRQGFQESQALAEALEHADQFLTAGRREADTQSERLRSK